MIFPKKLLDEINDYYYKKFGKYPSEYTLKRMFICMDMERMKSLNQDNTEMTDSD